MGGGGGKLVGILGLLGLKVVAKCFLQWFSWWFMMVVLASVFF